MNDDVKRPRLAAVGRHISAAISALFACVPLIHVSIGLIFLMAARKSPDD